MKKILSVIIACSLLASLSAFPLTVSAAEVSSTQVTAADSEEKITDDGLAYVIEDNGEVTITGYTEDFFGVKTYIIPEEIDGHKVTVIAPQAFSYADLRSVVFSEGLKEIGEGAFVGNWITDVTIPRSVEKIGDYAFGSYLEMVVGGTEYSFYYDEYELRLYGYEDTAAEEYCRTNIGTFYDLEADIDENGLVYKLDDNGEYTVKGIISEYIVESVDIPEEYNGHKVTKIGDSAFHSQPYLKSVTLHEGLREIEDAAFIDCPELREIFVPKSVQEIGYGAFNCTFVEYYDDENERIAFDYEEYDDKFYLSGYEGTCAEEYAYNSFDVIFIDVEEYVDEYCVGYKLNDEGEYTVKGVRYYAGKPVSEDIVVIKGEIDGHKVTSIAPAAFEGTSIKSISIPGEVKSIGAGAFNCCYFLADLTLGEGVEVIEECAFLDCESLSEVTIPRSVTKIGSENFGEYYDIIETDDGENMALMCEQITIKGYKGTEAQRFANSHEEITFVDLDSNETTIIPPVTDSDKIGDLDGDDKITSADSLEILRASVKLRGLSDREFKLADVDGDEEITSADALEVLRYSVKLGSNENIGKELK